MSLELTYMLREILITFITMLVAGGGGFLMGQRSIMKQLGQSDFRLALGLAQVIGVGKNFYEQHIERLRDIAGNDGDNSVLSEIGQKAAETIAAEIGARQRAERERATEDFRHSVERATGEVQAGEAISTGDAKTVSGGAKKKQKAGVFWEAKH